MRPGDDGAWRFGRGWDRPAPPRRLPLLLGAMPACGAATLLLGRSLRGLPPLERVLPLLLDVALAAAPLLATLATDAIAMRQDDGADAPPRALGPRVLLHLLGVAGAAVATGVALPLVVTCGVVEAVAIAQRLRRASSR